LSEAKGMVINMKDKIFSDLQKAMIEYDEELAKNSAQKSIEEGINPIDTINVLTEAITEIGDKFEKGELFLPDLMLAAKTMQLAIVPLEADLKKKGLKRQSIGKVVIGTVYGDLHSIGKSMVVTLLSANGFEAIDLGVNVEAKKFIEAVKKYNPDILAMSSLLTTTAPEQERVISALKDIGMRDKIKIMIGGGPITEEFANNIGADGYEPTATLAVKLAKNLVKNN